MSDKKILCQSCIERGIGHEEFICITCDYLILSELEKFKHSAAHEIQKRIKPNEACGTWQDLPICNECLGALVKNDYPDILPDQGISDLDKAKELFQEFDTLLEDWPLTSEECLNSRESFFTWRAPALVNMTEAEIEKIIDRRKSFLFAARVILEPEIEYIEKLKADRRAEAKLKGEDISGKEFTKVKKTSTKTSKQQKLNESMAKTLGITVAELEARMLAAEKKVKAETFKELTGVEVKELGPTVIQNEKAAENTKEILQDLKAKIEEKRKPASDQSISTGPKKCFRCQQEIESYAGHMKDCKGKGLS
jgi:hypothetical protein